MLFQKLRLNFPFAVKAFAILLTIGWVIAAVALTPYGRARWEFYRLTGRFTPKRIVETLQSPVHIARTSQDELLTPDGKLLHVPGVTNVVIPDPINKDIIGYGVEVAPDGTLYTLVRVHHWCGNDPVVFHLARVNLSSLLLLVADRGERFSDYGLSPGYLWEAKQPWPDIAEELRAQRGRNKVNESPQILQ